VCVCVWVGHRLGKQAEQRDRGDRRKQGTCTDSSRGCCQQQGLSGMRCEGASSRGLHA
jgi:hypothetical protein